MRKPEARPGPFRYSVVRTGTAVSGMRPRSCRLPLMRLVGLVKPRSLRSS